MEGDKGLSQLRRSLLNFRDGVVCCGGGGGGGGGGVGEIDALGLLYRRKRKRGSCHLRRGEFKGGRGKRRHLLEEEYYLVKKKAGR